MKNLLKYLITNYNQKEINFEIIVVKYSLLVALLSFIYSGFWFYYQYPLAGYINIFFSFCFLGITVCQYLGKITSYLLYAMLINANLFIFILSILTWESIPVLYAWFSVIPLFSILTLSKKQAYFWIFISLMFLILTYPIHSILLRQTNLCLLTPFNYTYNILQLSGVIFFSFFLGNQYMRFRNDQENILKIKNNELLDFQNKLEQTQKYKDSFFANISHEIRTPLNAIKGVSDLLAYNDVNNEDLNENAQLHTTLQTSTKQLLNLINDILEVSKLGSGNINLVYEKINIKETITKAFEILQFDASNKSILYKLNIHKNIPEIVLGDAQRLTQVLVNLLSNAIKFTEKGKVELIVDLLNIYRNSSHQLICNLRFNISDTGIGINEKSLKMLFTEYFQADPSISIKYGGTGLGLNISKKIVDLHNGTIDCKSEINKGTNLLVTIPYVIVEKEINKIEEAPKNIFDNKLYDLINNFKILLVDDIVSNLLIEKKLFLNKNKTLKIKTADNGSEAIEKSKTEIFDLILMDMQMPIMDGIEATKIIVGDINNPNNKTPIFGLTADISTETYNNCMEAGMRTVITKPFEMNIMLTEILKHLKS